MQSTSSEDLDKPHSSGSRLPVKHTHEPVIHSKLSDPTRARGGVSRPNVSSQRHQIQEESEDSESSDEEENDEEEEEEANSDNASDSASSQEEETTELERSFEHQVLDLLESVDARMEDILDFLENKGQYSKRVVTYHNTLFETLLEQQTQTLDMLKTMLNNLTSLASEKDCQPDVMHCITAELNMDAGTPFPLTNTPSSETLQTITEGDLPQDNRIEEISESSEPNDDNQPNSASESISLAEEPTMNAQTPSTEDKKRKRISQTKNHSKGSKKSKMIDDYVDDYNEMDPLFA